MLYSKRSTTPWQRIFAKFNMSQSQLAKELHCHRSKISRAVRDKEGLIGGSDQKRLLSAAARLGVALDADDFLPGIRQ